MTVKLTRVAIRYDRAGAWLCSRRQPRGWWCSRGLHLEGPCALRPAWWNLRGRRAAR